MKKMNIRVVVAVIYSASLSMIWWLGVAHSRSRFHSQEEAIVNREVAMVAYMALYSHRNRGADVMLLGMEGTLDNAVVNLWKHRDAMSGQDLASATSLLKEVKAYRQQHPRDRDKQPQLMSVQTAADEILNTL
jgi:hypothetical protein